MRVSDVLNDKGRTVVTIEPNKSAAELSLLLRERRIGAVIVSNDGETIDGVISERDLAYSLCTRGGDLHKLPVSELMTRQVITCSPHDSVGHVVSTMRSRNIRHVPVVVDELLHRGDLVLTRSRLRARHRGDGAREDVPDTAASH